MRSLRFAALFLMCLSLSIPSIAQNPKKKRLLAVGMSAGWEHESVSDALVTMYELGKQSGLWDTWVRTDTNAITKKKLASNAKNLDYFDAVFFMTTGELPMDDQQKADLISFVKEDGKGFLGAHNATDTFYKWPAYGEMIGGYFDGHPWNTFLATVIVSDRSFPATRHFPEGFQLVDEIYQTKDFSPDKVRVLMKLDTSKVNMSAKGVHSKEIPITWVKEFGKGRVFYSGLGHPPDVWARTDIRQMWLEAVKWAMGLTPADVTPRP
ncbi:MAG TPA: ThuA domain-containing protein [Acidobacteriota bacterium]|nr:ThuA domain-containing protein [Acidobacteriota bacterium]